METVSAPAIIAYRKGEVISMFIECTALGLESNLRRYYYACFNALKSQFVRLILVSWLTRTNIGTVSLSIRSIKTAIIVSDRILPTLTAFFPVDDLRPTGKYLLTSHYWSVFSSSDFPHPLWRSLESLSLSLSSNLISICSYLTDDTQPLAILSSLRFWFFPPSNFSPLFMFPPIILGVSHRLITVYRSASSMHASTCNVFYSLLRLWLLLAFFCLFFGGFLSAIYSVSARGRTSEG